HFLDGSIAFGLVPAAVIFFGRAPDLRLCDDAVAPQADEVVDARPAAVRVPVEEAGEPVIQLANDVRPDRVIEHRGGANLHRATPAPGPCRRSIPCRGDPCADRTS